MCSSSCSYPRQRGAHEHTEHELGRARSIHLGVGVSRVFRVAAGVTGFVSLSLDRRRWLDDAPLPGEHDDTQLTLSAGLRWK
ncbi:MAG: hypothetical protein AB7O24_10365 [Kofleriaceae bacterium]